MFCYDHIYRYELAMWYNNLLAGSGEQEEDSSGNDFKSKSKLHVVVPNVI